jgi:hypothetical protein
MTVSISNQLAARNNLIGMIADDADISLSFISLKLAIVIHFSKLSIEVFDVPLPYGTKEGMERDHNGMITRILEYYTGGYLIVDAKSTPPIGYTIACIKCGYDSFENGMAYSKKGLSVCPSCNKSTAEYCRYVAIAGGM